MKLLAKKQASRRRNRIVPGQWPGPGAAVRCRRPYRSFALLIEMVVEHYSITF
jgi:hypothetical protein